MKTATSHLYPAPSAHDPRCLRGDCGFVLNVEILRAAICVSSCDEDHPDVASEGGAAQQLIGDRPAAVPSSEPPPRRCSKSTIGDHPAEAPSSEPPPRRGPVQPPSLRLCGCHGAHPCRDRPSRVDAPEDSARIADVCNLDARAWARAVSATVNAKSSCADWRPAMRRTRSFFPLCTRARQQVDPLISQLMSRLLMRHLLTSGNELRHAS